jgi:signal peptidase
MEIETAPRLPAPTPWRRLVLFVVLFGPVTLLVLLPIGLGLDRYVMTGSSMEGSIDRGSIAFERVVPVSDLRVGDVVTFAEPAAAQPAAQPGDGPGDKPGDEPADAGDAMITHRIVSIDPDGIRTQGDAEAAADPWVLQPSAPTMSRVEFTVPWIGWAYLLLFRAQGWVLSIAAAAALVVLMTRRLRRPGATLRVPVEPDVVAAPPAEASGARVNGRDFGARGTKP